MSALEKIQKITNSELEIRLEQLKTSNSITETNSPTGQSLVRHYALEILVIEAELERRQTKR